MYSVESLTRKTGAEQEYKLEIIIAACKAGGNKEFQVAAEKALAIVKNNGDSVLTENKERG